MPSAGEAIRPLRPGVWELREEFRAHMRVPVRVFASEKLLREMGDRVFEQAGTIRKLNRTLHGFRVFSGAEVNLRDDGSLDVADEALAQLDVVGAAIHTKFRQSRTQMTRR